VTFLPINDPRFADTRFVVDATLEETHGVWFRWCYVWGLEMIQDCHGYTDIIGEIAGHPLRAEVFWYTVLGERVAFASIGSRVSDSVVLDEWVQHAFPNVRRHTDAGNFGNVVSDIEHYTGRGAGLRDFRRVDEVIERLPRIVRRP
jgi:hypothetical protein